MKTDNHTAFQVATNCDDTPVSPPRVRVVKAKDVEELKRSEHSLLYQLIRRNPVRAKEFLTRLDLSLK